MKLEDDENEVAADEDGSDEEAVDMEAFVENGMLEVIKYLYSRIYFYKNYAYKNNVFLFRMLQQLILLRSLLRPVAKSFLRVHMILTLPMTSTIKLQGTNLKKIQNVLFSRIFIQIKIGEIKKPF